MKKIKVLCILNSLDKCNGISTYIMNYYSGLDHEKFHFDFYITDNYVCEDYKLIIEKNSGKIFLGKRLKIKTLFQEMKKFKEILLNNDYDIVYSNILYTAFFYFYEAKKCRVKHRILHSHNTPTTSSFGIRNILYGIMKKLAVEMSNIYFACSDYAGRYLFGKRKFHIIRNAIDIKKYEFNNEIRQNYRKKFNIENNYCVVHIGRFSVQKNHQYIVEIMKKIVKYEKDIKFIFIGYGELEEKIKNEIIKNGLEKNAIFLGVRNDINNILQAMDVFILPSLYEGLPLVSIEAQACGLPNVLSSNISKEVKLTSSVEFLDIGSNNVEKWCNEILKFKMFKRGKSYEEISKEGYNIEVERKKLEKILLDIVNEKIRE